MKYNETKHNEAVAALGKLREQHDEIAKHVQDYTDKFAVKGDVAPSDEDNRTQEARLMAVTNLRSEISSIERFIEKQEDAKPLDADAARAQLASPFVRWARSPHDGALDLSAEERERFVRNSASDIKMGDFVDVPDTVNADLSLSNVLDQIALPGNPRNVSFFIEPMQGVDNMFDPKARRGEVQNVLRSDVSPGGEDWAPIRVDGTLRDRLAYIGGMVNAGSEMRTSHGNDIKFPILDDTGESGELLANQGASATGQDLQNLSEVTLKAEVMSSKFVEANLMLQRDVSFDIDRLVAQRLDRRMARGWNIQFTTGDGTGANSRGVTIDAKAGVTAASETTFTGNELLQLMDEVDYAYLDDEGDPAGLAAVGGGHIGWMMHQKSLGIARRIQGNGQYLWRPGLMGLQYGDPDSLAGYPYRMNNAMAVAPSQPDALKQRVVLFGNMGYYMQRFVNLRINARFFDSGTAGAFKARYIAFTVGYGRFVGGFSAGNTCEAVAYLELAE